MPPSHVSFTLLMKYFIFIDDADKNVSESVYICRARKDADWIPGQLIRETKKCYFSLLGIVSSNSNYEVLQNVDNGSKLTWYDWDTYHTHPAGIIKGGENLFVARKKVATIEDNDIKSHVDGALKSLKGYSHYVGKFNAKDGFGKVTIITEVITVIYFYG